MSIKVLIADEIEEGKLTLLLMKIKEKYGDDVIILTPDQAKEQNLTLDDFANIPKLELKSIHIDEIAYLTAYCFDKTEPSKKSKTRKREHRWNSRKHDY